MTNNLKFSVLFIFILAACSPPADKQQSSQPAPTMAAAAATAKWTVTEGIDTPESVYADPDSGFIFVSQVTGQPGERDGTGRIVKLSPDGKVISAMWVTGLNAPKGLRSFKGILWTADIDEVVGMEISSGRVVSRVKIPGAQFLNDLACGADGTVYVSDTMLSKIFAIKDGKASVFAEGEELEYPNGLLAEGDRLVVGGWGKPEPDFSTKIPGRLFALDLKTKQKTRITRDPVGNIDGVESDGKGGYIVTDWMAGKILRISPQGDVRVITQFAQGTADHAFLPAGNLLIVPHMNENKVAAYDIANALR